MIKLCVFDLDGTLAMTLDSMAAAANRALLEIGLAEQPAEKFRYFAGDGAKELCRRVLRAAGDEKELHYEEMYQKYRVYFGETCMYRVQPYEGIRELLEELKTRGVKIAVLSNKPHEQAVDVVETLFGRDYFDAIQGQTEKIPRKPSPAGALFLAEKFREDPKDCLYIGDTGTDMRTGKAAGMKTAGVLWGFRDKEELMENHADVLVQSPAKILSLLE
jgi:phosphoglycolate phosphatase